MSGTATTTRHTRRRTPPRWVRPQTLSVFAALPAAEVSGMRAALRNSAGALALDQLHGLHYLRLFVLDGFTDLEGMRGPARLVLSAVFDGTVEEFLTQWIGLARERLRALFGRCEGFPGSHDDVMLREWLLQRAQRPQTYYIGAVGLSATEVRAEQELHSAIQGFIDEQQREGRWMHNHPGLIRDEIRAFVASRRDLLREPRPPIPWKVRMLKLLDLVRILALLLAAPALLAWLCVPAARLSNLAWLAMTPAVLVGLLAGWFLVVRVYELVERDAVLTPPPHAVARLVEDEDRSLQNQFTMVSLVRDSAFRRMNLRFVLWLSNGLSRHVWNRGELAGIGTIHFARIHQIDRGRRMLFMSDFDGSWERYLFDFLTTGSFAVVPNWTNLHGCPKSRFMLWPPRPFPQRFLPFTRANQVSTEVWYNAIGDLSVADILRNARIRAGLFGPLTVAETRAWLALF